MHGLRPLPGNHGSRECTRLLGRLCALCVSRLDQELRSLRELYEESEQSLTRTAPRLRERVSGSRSSAGIVLDEDTVALRSRAADVLAQWARLVVEESRGRVPRPREPRLEALVRLLREQLGWLAGHPAAVDFAEEVAELLAAFGRLHDLGRVRTFPLGPCPQAGCDGVLQAVMSAGGGRVPSHVGCEAGHALPPHEWMRVAVRLEGEAA